MMTIKKENGEILSQNILINNYESEMNRPDYFPNNFRRVFLSYLKTELLLYPQTGNFVNRSDELYNE